MRTSFELIVIGSGSTADILLTSFLFARPDGAVLHIDVPGLADAGRWTRTFHPSHLPGFHKDVQHHLISHVLAEHAVRFPGFERHMGRPLAVLTPEHLRESAARLLRSRPENLRITAREAVTGADHKVFLPDGNTFSAPVVVDLRPSGRAPSHVVYQHLDGFRWRVRPPRIAVAARLMDADIPQHRGFTFIRQVPLPPDGLLVTRSVFSESPAPPPRLRPSELLPQGIEAVELIAEETVSMAVPWRAPRVDPALPLRLNPQDGWCHPATGDELLPVARFGADIAEAINRGETPAITPLVRNHQARLAFPSLLNELIFRATPAASQWKVFKHFHEGDVDLIERFFGLEETPGDRLRLVFRRPPPGVNLLKAAAILSRHGFSG